MPVSRLPIVTKRGYSTNTIFLTVLGAGRDTGLGNNCSQFYIDMDIITNQRVLNFESVNWNNIIEIVDIVRAHAITVVDVTHIYDIFKKYNNPINRMHQFEKHYGKWAKEFHLDNPRSNTFDTKQYVLSYWNKPERNLIVMQLSKTIRYFFCTMHTKLIMNKESKYSCKFIIIF